MKKAMVIVMMVILVISMATTATAGYWDDKEIAWLSENTIAWCNENGYEKWAEPHCEDGLALGCAIITKNDSVFYDATPSSITDRTYITRMEEVLGTAIHSIEIIHNGQEGGYDIYRLIIKWDDPLITSEQFGCEPIYGEDMFVRFYN